MSKACCFSLGFVFNCFSLMLLVLTISSNYWYVAEKGSAEGNILTNVSIQPLLYPYSLGLWMTCYGKNVPDTGEYVQNDLMLYAVHKKGY